MQRENKEAYWTEVITASRGYAAGISSYCRDNNVSKKNYYSWFAKLKSAHPEWGVRIRLPGENEVVAGGRKNRRNFTAAQKASILAELDSAEHGQIGFIMRREGVYSVQIKKWREERALRQLEPAKRGPSPKPAETEEDRLRKENEALKRKLAQAENIIEIQKKISNLLGINQENS